jgi:DNA-binding HxlR family transcriptional regulator
MDVRFPEIASRNCSIARTLSVLGERWTLLVLRQSFLGVKRFGDFQATLGIARNTLTDRLNMLVEEGILERRPYQQRPLRHEYKLTRKGRDLYPVLVSLMSWGDRYNADDGPPVLLIHEGCGHEADPHLTCSHCGEEIDAREMRPVPGPGALAPPEAA